MTTLPDIATLLEALDYDPWTGKLHWRRRPRSHFDTERGWRNSWKFAGREAGHLMSSTGYVLVRIGGDLIGAHRIAFAITHGWWPEYVDHVNGAPTDNRILNLRACTKEENCRNRKCNSANVSGLKGVSRVPRGKKWQARIQVSGRQISLGSFDTPEEAHAAYVKAAHEFHGAFARHQ